jgi:hypothetical protein
LKHLTSHLAISAKMVSSPHDCLTMFEISKTFFPRTWSKVRTTGSAIEQSTQG